MHDQQHGYDDEWLEEMDPIAHELLAKFDHDLPIMFTVMHGAQQIASRYRSHNSMTTPQGASEDLGGMQHDTANVKPLGLQASRGRPAPTLGINQATMAYSHLATPREAGSQSHQGHDQASLPRASKKPRKSPCKAVRPSLVKAQQHNR
jgi:hypothetical protein